MLDTRESFFDECDRKQFHNAHRFRERIFGFHDIEYADDTNLIHTHLPSLRVLAKCYLREAAYYVFFCE